MKPSNKVRFAILHNVPVLLQMLNLVMIRRRQIRAHAAVVACNDNTTASCRLLLIDSVSDLESRFLVRLLQDLCLLVFAHAAEVNYRVRREQVLCSSCRVLCGSSCEEFCFAVVHELIVERHVFLFGEDRIVGFQAVLLQEGIVSTQQGQLG